MAEPRFRVVRTEHGWQVQDMVTGNVTLPVAVEAAAVATMKHLERRSGWLGAGVRGS